MGKFDVVDKDRYLADAMMGKLGRFLRILGFDTRFADVSLPDSTLLVQSLDERRILLTRDVEFSEIMKEKLKELGDVPENVFYFDQQDIVGQLTQFFQQSHHNPLDFLWDGTETLSHESRCAKCNHDLREVEKSEILDKIPQGTAERYTKFWQCTDPSCQQIYWIGDKHWTDINNHLQEVSKRLA